MEYQVRCVADQFEQLGYDREFYRIPGQGALEGLKEKINGFLDGASERTLLIIYYAGHGGISNSELVLCR